MAKKKKKYKHPYFKYMVIIKWSPKDNVYVAEVPELSGCMTHGESIEEAAMKANEAIESWIDGAKETDFPIPEPLTTKRFSGKFITRIDPEIHRILMLKAKEVGKTLNRFIEDILKKEVA